MRAAVVARVDVEDVVPALAEVAHDPSTRLAAATRDHDPHRHASDRKSRRRPVPGAPGVGMRTVNTAPPPARLAASIRPPCRSTIQWAMARPRPVPSPGCPARDRTGRTGAAGPRVGCPARRPRRRASASPSTARTRTATWPPSGHVADGVVDEDDDELAQAGRVADDLGRLRVHRHRHAPMPRRRSPASRPRSRRRRRGRPAPARARSRRSRSGRAAAGRRPSPPGGRPRRGCRSRAEPTVATGSSRWRSRSSTLARMTVSGVRNSCDASAANSRWRCRASRWATSDWRIGTSARLA